MHKFFLMLACSTLILSVSSCKKSDSDPSPNSGPVGSNDGVTFLRVGATSTYHEKSFFNDDTIYTVVDREVAQDTFLVRNYTSISTVAPSVYLALKDGVLSSSYRLRDQSSYQILCKFNQPVGTSWTVYRNGTPSYTATIDALNATIATGKGNLTDAVKVKIVTLSNSVSYQYYSPTAGIISAGSGSETLYMKNYTLSNAASTAPLQVPAITYGNFPFLNVGNFWKYDMELNGSDDSLTLQVLSKDSRNVYKVNVKIKNAGANVNEYWFEDNGYLMVYQEGETALQADPIYMKPSAAMLHYGWVGISGTTSFVYRITSLNTTATSQKYGTQSCMEIDVTTGIFSSQYNYWNADKGQVFVSGFNINQDLDLSNVRQSEPDGLFFPGLHI